MPCYPAPSRSARQHFDFAVVTALGYGAAWLTGWIAYDRDVLAGLGRADGEKLAGFIHVGSRSKPVEDRPRPAPSEIVTWFRAATCRPWADGRW